MNFDVSIFLQLVQAVKGKGSALQSLGMTLLTLSFLGQLVTVIYSYWLEGNASKFLGSCMRLAVMTSLPLAALTNWGAAGNAVPNFFTNQVAPAVGNGDVSAQLTKLNDIFNRITDSFNRQAARTEASNEGSATTPPLSLPGTTAGDAMQASTSGTGSAGFLSGILNLGQTLKEMLVTIAIGLILGIGCAVLILAYCATLYGSLVILYLGVVFGPILVSLFPFAPLSSYARNWLNFMIANGLTYAVAVALVSIANSSLDVVIARLTDPAMPILPDPNGANPNSLGAIGMALVGCALMLFFAWMMSKADNIAQAMISGGSGGTGHGFVAVMTRTVSKLSNPSSAKPSTTRPKSSKP